MFTIQGTFFNFCVECAAVPRRERTFNRSSKFTGGWRGEGGGADSLSEMIIDGVQSKAPPPLGSHHLHETGNPTISYSYLPRPNIYLPD